MGVPREKQTHQHQSASPASATEFPRKMAILSVSQMAEVERLAMVAGITEYALMEHAGTAVATGITHRWSARPITVLCGPGKNGGDGFVAARHLSEAGWPVRLALLGDVRQLTGVTRQHAERWCGSIKPLHPEILDGASLVVDALFGSGLDRILGESVQAILNAVVSRGIPLVAIDVPSGLVGDTGENWGAVASELTITFVRKKPAHLLQPGRGLCGEVVVADIGISESVVTQIRPDSFENDPSLWFMDLPRLGNMDNKYTRGHALISGGYPQTGAARLAARGAARAGAGMTTIAVPSIALPIYASALTSILVHPLETEADFDTLLTDHRITAFLIGPGAGLGIRTHARVLAMLRAGRPTVLDADALSEFGDDPIELFSEIVAPCILTPHDGEFSRLFDSLGGKLERTRIAARRSGAIVLLKGSDTVIAAADGRAIINTNAPPSLATAGSGDVLAGIILGLLTQGMDPFRAAAAGVWLHGEAANRCGPGLIAEDLPEYLPTVWRDLQHHANSGSTGFS